MGIFTGNTQFEYLDQFAFLSILRNNNARCNAVRRNFKVGGTCHY